MTRYFASGKSHDATNLLSSPPVPPQAQAKLEAAPEPQREVSLRNVGSYLSAEAGLHLHGPVADEVYEQRKAACMGCDRRVTVDRLPDEIGFCGRCGCGVSEKSRLTVKLRMPGTTCPLAKFGRSPGRHPRLLDRVKSWAARKILGA